MTTIIEPNKKRAFMKYITPFIVLVAGSAIASVAMYVNTVDLRHELEDRQAYAQELTVYNVELKNQLYSLFDTDHMKVIAENAGLVLDKNPIYLQTPLDELVAKTP
jgi:cell division protein FtsL